MGVESDRLVFDYLSRVADLAQTALPAAQRMRLVAQLRKDIESAPGGTDSPAAVQRILGRIGSPDEVVEAAASGSSGTSAASGASGRGGGSPAPAVPVAPPPRPTEPPAGTGGPFAKPRRPASAPADAAGEPGPRLRKDADEPDWWRVGTREERLSVGDELTGLPGMTGQILIPFDDAVDDAAPGEGEAAPGSADGEAAEAEEEAPAAPKRRRLLPAFRKGGGKSGKGKGDAAKGGAAKSGRRWSSPMLLLAAALLVVGAVMGSWIPLLLGWGAGWLSRQLSRPQAKFAVFGIPGTAALGLFVWLWGRDAGKWGTPIAQGQMGHAIHDALPLTVRLAATASALFFLSRART